MPSATSTERVAKWREAQKQEIAALRDALVRAMRFVAPNGYHQMHKHHADVIARAYAAQKQKET